MDINHQDIAIVDIVSRVGVEDPRRSFDALEGYAFSYEMFEKKAAAPADKNE